MQQQQQRQGPAQQIRFMVSKSSPPLPGFPANELEVQSVNTKGFQTANCPAELVLELVGGGRFDLSELQILSHESKIAARIEVSVLLLGSETFQTLGYMEFEDNSRSGYLARELQSVKISCVNATHVRLVFTQAHVNQELNPHRHVGIIGMNLLGWKRQHESTLSNASSMTAITGNNNSSMQHMPLPSSDSVASLLRRVDELKNAKEAAVAREAYEEALQLKNEELEAQRLAELAQDLERSKQEAVYREDYEEAQRIKAKLEELLNPNRRTASSSSLHHHHHHTPNKPIATTSSSSRANSPMERRSPVTATTNAMRSASPPVPAILARYPKQSPQQQQQQQKPPQEAAPQGFWNAGNEQTLVAEDLEPTLKSSSEVKAMNATFGTYFSRCLYSSHDQLRIAVLDKLKHELQQHRNEEEDTMLDAALFAASVGLNEPNSPQVFPRAVEIVRMVIELMPPERARYNPCMEQTVFPRLLDALAVANAQHAASDLFVRIIRHVYDLQFAVKLITTQTSKRSVASTLWRPFLSRLHILSTLVKPPSEVVTGVVAMDILEWIKANSLFTHSNDKIQQLCMELAVLLYQKSSIPVRGEIKTFLQVALRPTQLSQYMSAMQSSTVTSSGVSHATSTSPASAAGRTSGFRSSPAVAAAHPCVFCNKATFQDEEDLDLHMWKDCPMLSSCPHCSQVIEISKLNEHLLKECDLKANHKACPRCHEAIAVALFTKHVKRNACLVAKPEQDANRCPLCHDDVYPGEAGWRVHLMRDLCPNNARTSETSM